MVSSELQLSELQMSLTLLCKHANSVVDCVFEMSWRTYCSIFERARTLQLGFRDFGRRTFSSIYTQKNRKRKTLVCRVYKLTENWKTENWLQDGDVIWNLIFDPRSEKNPEIITFIFDNGTFGLWMSFEYDTVFSSESNTLVYLVFVTVANNSPLNFSCPYRLESCAHVSTCLDQVVEIVGPLS